MAAAYAADSYLNPFAHSYALVSSSATFKCLRNRTYHILLDVFDGCVWLPQAHF